MDQLWTAIITTACTVAASLLVTYLFNKISGVPKKLSDEKKAREQKIASLEQKDAALMTKIEAIDSDLRNLLNTNFTALNSRLECTEEAISHYPEYRAQSLEIQASLKAADVAIVDLCREIKDEVKANGEMMNERLSSLELRERNALRAEILKQYRLYTDERKNPMRAWTSMEHHSFGKLVEDYESLGGNEYVHHTILPEMDRLEVISIDNLEAVKALYDSRSPGSVGQV